MFNVISLQLAFLLSAQHVDFGLFYSLESYFVGFLVEHFGHLSISATSICIFWHLWQRPKKSKNHLVLLLQTTSKDTRRLCVCVCVCVCVRVHVCACACETEREQLSQCQV